MVRAVETERTNLGRGVRGLDSRDRTLPLFPLARFRDVSRDFAPPAPLFGDRSLQKSNRQKFQENCVNNSVIDEVKFTDRWNDYV